MRSFPTWAVRASDDYRDYHRSTSVGGDYCCAASSLICDFQTLGTFGGLIFIYDFRDFWDFRDFQTNIALSPDGLHKKETKIAMFLVKNCYLLKFPCKNMEVRGSPKKPLQGAESLGVRLPLPTLKTPHRG